MTTRVRREFEFIQERARTAVRHGGFWVQFFARAGHATKAIAYGMAGAIAILFALGRRDISSSEPNVLQTILSEPMGWLLVTLLALGLTLQGFWLMGDAIFDFHGRGTAWKARMARFGMMFRGGVHVGVAIFVALVLLERSHAEANHAVGTIVGFFMGYPLGAFAVGSVGLGIALYGLSSIVTASRIDFEHELKLRSMSRARYDITTITARFGLVARGVVFVLIGLFVFLAALYRNPSEAKGIGDVLSTIRSAAYGRWLLCTVGAGLIAYGIYELIRARYLRIRPA